MPSIVCALPPLVLLAGGALVVVGNVSIGKGPLRLGYSGAVGATEGMGGKSAGEMVGDE